MSFFPFPAGCFTKLSLADTFVCKTVHFAFLSAAVIETIFAIAIGYGISAPFIQYTFCHIRYPSFLSRACLPFSPHRRESAYWRSAHRYSSKPLKPQLRRDWQQADLMRIQRRWCKVTPETVAVKIITQLGTTKFSDMGSLIHKTMPHRVIRDPVGRLFLFRWLLWLTPILKNSEIYRNILKNYELHGIIQYVLL